MYFNFYFILEKAESFTERTADSTVYPGNKKYGGGVGSRSGSTQQMSTQSTSKQGPNQPDGSESCGSGKKVKIIE